MDLLLRFCLWAFPNIKRFSSTKMEYLSYPSGSSFPVLSFNILLAQFLCIILSWSRSASSTTYPRYLYCESSPSDVVIFCKKICKISWQFRLFSTRKFYSFKSLSFSSLHFYYHSPINTIFPWDMRCYEFSSTTWPISVRYNGFGSNNAVIR